MAKIGNLPCFKRAKSKKNWVKHYVRVPRIPGENYLSICKQVLPPLTRHWAIVWGDAFIHIKWVALTLPMSDVVIDLLKAAISHDINRLSMTGLHAFSFMFDGYAQQVFYEVD